MPEELNNTPTPEPSGEPAAASSPEPENTVSMTQEELNRRMAREKGTGERAILKLFGVSKREEAENLAADFKTFMESRQNDEDYKEKYEKVQAELAELRHEQLLKAKGVPVEDLDYHLFKVNQLITEDKTFEEAVEEYLKDKTFGDKPTMRVSTSLPTGDGTGAPKSANEQMNALIRGIRK